MPSFVWDREPGEAYHQPYEYEAQNQFTREAAAVLKELKQHYAQRDLHIASEDKTAEKAIWMLQVDALGALTDALELVNRKRHRLASRLFRDFVETMDASFYFFHASEESRANLQRWYKNLGRPECHDGHRDKYVEIVF